MISIESKGAVSILPGRAIAFAAVFLFHHRVNMALARRELPTVCGDEQISGGGGGSGR
jgi:hypothetical protein